MIFFLSTGMVWYGIDYYMPYQASSVALGSRGRPHGVLPVRVIKPVTGDHHQRGFTCLSVSSGPSIHLPIFNFAIGL